MTVEVRDHLDPAARAEVAAFLASVAGDQCDAPLDERHRAALGAGSAQAARALLARRGDGVLAGYAQLLPAEAPGGPGRSALEGQRAVAGAGASARGLTASLLSSAAAAARDAGSTLSWWARHAVPADQEAAALAGLVRRRCLLQVRRPAGAGWPPHWSPGEPPAGPAAALRTRPFRVGADERAWLGVNARAFAALADQGSWTAAELAAREAEDWFDPDGFLVRELGGRIAGFCWTRVHPPAPSVAVPRLASSAGAPAPTIGEIYVIGVDPDFRGQHLGSALLRAGCEHLERDGAGEVMLYVDAANAPARALYDAAGFTLHHEDHRYESRAEESPAEESPAGEDPGAGLAR